MNSLRIECMLNNKPGIISRIAALLMNRLIDVKELYYKHIEDAGGVMLVIICDDNELARRVIKDMENVYDIIDFTSASISSSAAGFNV